MRSMRVLTVMGVSLFLFLFLRQQRISLDEELYWYCPVCHGQTLWESNHPEALAIVEQVEEWKREDVPKEQISVYLYEKYGSKMFRTAGSRWILPLLLGLYWYKRRIPCAP